MTLCSKGMTGLMTRRKILGSAAAIALLGAKKAAAGLHLHGGSIQTLQPLKLGAGGQFSGFSIANDDTHVIRTDTYGAYIWNPNATVPTPNSGATGAWQQLVNSNAMPASFVSNGPYAGQGVYEIAIAPNNSSVLYMVYITYPSSNPNQLSGVYKSTTGGVSWTQTAFTPIDNNTLANPNNVGRLNSQRMTIHPTDPTIVFVGFESTGGLWATADGGTTWGKPSGFPTPTGSPAGITGIVFNPNNPNQAYAFSQGNGVYVSNNANLGNSSTWSAVTTTGGPSNVKNADFASDGSKYYVCTASMTTAGGTGGAVLSFNGTSWATEVSGTSAQAVCCDPNSASHVLAVDGSGNLNEHTGSGWSGWTSSPTFGNADIPWLLQLANVGVGVNNATFSRTISSKVYINCFNESYYTTAATGSVTTGTSVTWTSHNNGEEQLNPNTMLSFGSGKVIGGFWDHPIFVPDLSSYPSRSEPDNNGDLSACWSLDNAKFTNTNFVAAISDPVKSGYGNGATGCKSCYSATGAANSFTKFLLAHNGVSPSIPSNAYNGSSGFGGGDIAISSPTNFVWAPAGGTTPQFTTDAGVNWTACSFAGSPSFASFNSNPQSNRFVEADPVTQNAFYLFYPGVGFYRSTNSGSTWSLTSGSVGRPTNLDNTGYIKCVQGQSGHVWFTSTTTRAPPYTFLLAPYSGHGAYPNNFGGTYYTTDGGATFNQVNNADFSVIAFGAAAPGQSYPAIYGVGFVSYHPTDSVSIVGSGSVSFTVGSGLSSTFQVGAPIGVGNIGGNSYMAGTIASYSGSTVTITVNSSGTASGSGPFSSWYLSAYGIWQCTTGPAASPVWTQLGPWTTNSFDQARALAADPVVYGQIYIGFAGSGAIMRK